MNTLSVHSAMSGGVEYSIPIDYNAIQESELITRAEFYYDKALKSGGELSEDTTAALNLYTMLKNKTPENQNYSLRLGKLYDLIGKDRYAKGNYYQAMGVNTNSPAPYYYLGDFYFKRAQYRKALKMYKKAYALGYSENEDMLNKMEIIKRKLGI